jgi:plasmid stabilization system protein ParE
MARGSQRPLEWSEAARLQLAEQIEYATSRGLVRPDEVLNRIDRSARLIERHPGIGTPGRRAGTREWPVKDSPLTLIYRIRPKKIQVLAVVHQRRFFRSKSNT